MALVEENSGNLNQSVGTIKGSGAAIVKSTDSLPPQWEAVPISGRYQNKVSVELKCLEEKCKLFFMFVIVLVICF